MGGCFLFCRRPRMGVVSVHTGNDRGGNQKSDQTRKKGAGINFISGKSDHCWNDHKDNSPAAFSSSRIFARTSCFNGKKSPTQRGRMATDRDQTEERFTGFCSLFSHNSLRLGLCLNPAPRAQISNSGEISCGCRRRAVSSGGSSKIHGSTKHLLEQRNSELFKRSPIRIFC